MSVPDPATTKWVPLWNTGASQGAGAGLITGDLVWSVLAARTGAVSCDGSLYDSVVDNTFAALYAAIGTTYGGTGPTSFAVPDVRGRLLVARGTNPDVNAVGKNDGEPNVANRTPLHWHPAQGGLVWSGSFAGIGGNTGFVSSDHAHYNNFNTSGRSADHTHNLGVSLDGSTSGAGLGAYVGTDHGINMWGGTTGESVDHLHAVAGWTGGISANHTHAYTPSGSVNGNISGYVGSPRNDQVQDKPAYIVENCFIIK